MNVALAVSWGFRRRLALALIAVELVACVLAYAHEPDALVSVVVRKVDAAGAAPERTVAELGGTVQRRLGIIDGFSATIPARALDALRSAAGVRSVSLNRTVRPMHVVDGFDGATDPGSMYNTTKIIRAQDLWRSGITGHGVDVALIDSGVVPVNGLTVSGKVVNGPDLSFESQSDTLRYLDTYGHGTHMAGIIAGHGDSAQAPFADHDRFAGVAPEARLVSVKVADSSGATDVSQVIAAIDWVVQHRNSNGMNIRVLNLSFGTDGLQSYVDDPLAFATEVAWRSGIVVVVAGGNAGANVLSNPASDPFVIAVGADDPRGTPETSDDTIPSWSSRGDGVRNPDLVAPGKSIVSLRDVGSNIDVSHPEGRVNTRFFRGSGTSQAAAVASGAAALLLQDRPNLTPDQVKRLLTSSALPLPGVDASTQGAGLLNVRNAVNTATPSTTQSWTPSTGTGSLEGSRGSYHVAMNGTELSGAQDIFGAAWDAATWAAASAAGTSWVDGTWNGNLWSGSDWSGNSWASSTWSSSSWSSSSWSGEAWYSSSWSSSSWSSSSWSSSSWSSSSWSSSSWSSSTWSSNIWASSAWE
jgi:serine protease AprX